MRLGVLALAAAALIAAPAQAGDEADPAPHDEVVDDTSFPRFGLGVRTGGIVLFPLLGPVVGLEGRVRLLEWVSIEPHVDLVAPIFGPVGFPGVQAGVPLLLEPPGSEGPRLHFGAGPLVASMIAVGHIEGRPPPMNLVGAEAVLGVGWPVNESLELRLQGRAFMVSMVPRFLLMPGATATAGVMWTF